MILANGWTNDQVCFSYFYVIFESLENCLKLFINYGLWVIVQVELSTILEEIIYGIKSMFTTTSISYIKKVFTQYTIFVATLCPPNHLSWWERFNIKNGFSKAVILR